MFTLSPLGLTIIPTGSSPPTPGGLPPPPPSSSGQYPACTVPGPGGLNVELKTEPLTYSGDSGPPGHMPEAMMGAYTGGPEGYGAYHGGYEEAAARHGGAWPGGVAGAGYHHHHHASLAQGSPTQRYPYYDSR